MSGTAERRARRAARQRRWYGRVRGFVPPPAGWLRHEEVEAALGVSRTRIDALRRAGKLRAEKPRGRWLYDPASVAALVADRAARGLGVD